MIIIKKLRHILSIYLRILHRCPNTKSQLNWYILYISTTSYNINWEINGGPLLKVPLHHIWTIPSVYRTSSDVTYIPLAHDNVFVRVVVIKWLHSQNLLKYFTIHQIACRIHAIEIILVSFCAFWSTRIPNKAKFFFRNQNHGQFCVIFYISFCMQAIRKILVFIHTLLRPRIAIEY